MAQLLNAPPGRIPDAPPAPSNNSFPGKLHRMLTDIEQNADAMEHCVSWAPHGRCFLVKDKAAFITTVLPKYFYQLKYISFQRHLNLYGFRKMQKDGPDKGSYYHDFFLRGRPQIAQGIKRSKAKGDKFKSCDEEPNFYVLPPMPAVSRTQVPPLATNYSAAAAMMPIGNNIPGQYQQQHALMPAAVSASPQVPADAGLTPFQVDLLGGFPGNRHEDMALRASGLHPCLHTPLHQQTLLAMQTFSGLPPTHTPQQVRPVAVKSNDLPNSRGSPTALLEGVFENLLASSGTAVSVSAKASHPLGRNVPEGNQRLEAEAMMSSMRELAGEMNSRHAPPASMQIAKAPTMLAPDDSEEQPRGFHSSDLEPTPLGCEARVGGPQLGDADENLHQFQNMFGNYRSREPYFLDSGSASIDAATSAASMSDLVKLLDGSNGF